MGEFLINNRIRIASIQTASRLDWNRGTIPKNYSRVALLEDGHSWIGLVRGRWTFSTRPWGSIAIGIKAGSGWPSGRKGAKAKERKRVGSWKHVGGRGTPGKGAGADKTLVGHIFAAGGRLLERSSTIAGIRSPSSLLMCACKIKADGASSLPSAFLLLSFSSASTLALLKRCSQLAILPCFAFSVLLRVNFGLGGAFQSSFSTKSIFALFV